ncbi:GNAT family N-acetyltransferase [Actinopolymorpha rutila]|uniref:Ribosomal-protein-alanine N-acetyltransferase n=1 Tax=Actinopolymorpha rutila TaxID=446787 RepID=A0A852ZG81_9ACTN|nr:GNAT family protein [Actinopolymorpha rutila]NYH88010.1 ribosomal-protein-alanine N-acetyltransferase [Actinopolymorpha rutila]
MPDSSIRLQPATPDVAEAVLDALVRSREHMRPWDPDRPADFFTARAQAERLANPDVRRWHLVDGDVIAGEFTLSMIALGAFRSANLGYWIDVGYTRRGLANRGVEQVCQAARDEVGLHRVEASTIVENVASQGVLRKSGFEQIGTAPRYLYVAGEWQDCHLFQRILHDKPPPLP